jgi:hypothetical protein
VPAKGATAQGGARLVGAVPGTPMIAALTCAPSTLFTPHPPNSLHPPLPGVQNVFKTPIWHPSVAGANGGFCLGDDRPEWPLELVVTRIRAIFASPEVQHINAEAAMQLKTDPAAFEARARADTERYAMG